MVLGIVATIVLAIYRAKRMSDRGQNPLTLQEDLAYRAMQSRRSHRRRRSSSGWPNSTTCTVVA